MEQASSHLAGKMPEILFPEFENATLYRIKRDLQGMLFMSYLVTSQKSSLDAYFS